LLPYVEIFEERCQGYAPFGLFGFVYCYDDYRATPHLKIHFAFITKISGLTPLSYFIFIFYFFTILQSAHQQISTSAHHFFNL